MSVNFCLLTSACKLAYVRFWHEADKAVELKVGNERKADVMIMNLSAITLFWLPDTPSIAKQKTV
mgnify:CR=1 FL=1